MDYLNWRRGLRFYLWFAFFVLNGMTLKAQSTMDSLLIKALQTDELLPILIDSAIQFSPEVTRVGHTVELAKDAEKMNKFSILSAVSLLSSYNYGTNFSAITNPTGAGASNNFTKAQTGYYNVGVGFQLPLSLLLNRKTSLHAAKEQVEASASEKEKAALFVKQEVIRLYQEFKLAHTLIQLGSRNKQAAQINYDLAEKNFVQGQITLSEITGIQDSYNKAIMEFETDINRFQTDYMQLEAYTGVNLSSLIKKVK